MPSTPGQILQWTVKPWFGNIWKRKQGSLREAWGQTSLFHSGFRGPLVSSEIAGAVACLGSCQVFDGPWAGGPWSQEASS